MGEHEDEIELMDLLNVIWKKKWAIILPTLFCVIVAGVIIFLSPSKWDIDAIIQPSKFLVQTEQGAFEEVVVVDPLQIVGMINRASYNQLIIADLNLDINKFPKIQAENIQDTKLVRVLIREKDVEKAKSILVSLFNHLKTELDKKVEIEIKGIDSQIKSNDIEILRKKEEIKTFKKKLTIVEQRKKEIEKEMIDTRKLIEELKKEHLLGLSKKNRSETESLAMLLYSNEIQQSLRYHNTLNELLNSKKIEEEDINLGIKNNEEGIKQLENTIDNLNERKGRIDYAELVKKPTSTLFPVSPRKKLIVTIAGIISLMIFTMLSFLLEYIHKKRVL